VPTNDRHAVVLACHRLMRGGMRLARPFLSEGTPQRRFWPFAVNARVTTFSDRAIALEWASKGRFKGRPAGAVRGRQRGRESGGLIKVPRLCTCDGPAAFTPRA
jgi:hypothetical protein